MGKKSKRNKGASKKQKNARVQQGGVTNTSANSDVAAAVVGHEIEPSTIASIRRDPIDSLWELLEKGDNEGILKLESNLVLRAAVLEGTDPQHASSIYLAIVNAFVETEFSSTIARKKAIHYLELSFALSEKQGKLHQCVRLLVPLYIQEGRHDEAFATVKRLTVRIPQHELIDPDLT